MPVHASEPAEGSPTDWTGDARSPRVLILAVGALALAALLPQWAELPAGSLFWNPALPLALVLVHWCGPRVLVAAFLAQLGTAHLCGLPWSWAPLLALPGTAAVGLSWLGSARRSRRSAWLKETRSVARFLVAGMALPLLTGDFLLCLLLAFEGGLEPGDLAPRAFGLWTVDLFAGLSVALPLALFASRKLWSLGWSELRAAPAPALFPSHRRSRRQRWMAGGTFALLALAAALLPAERFWFVAAVFLLASGLQFGIGLAGLGHVWVGLLSFVLARSGIDGAADFGPSPQTSGALLQLTLIGLLSTVAGRVTADRTRELQRRRRTEHALRRSEERLQGVLDSLDEVVWSVDAWTGEGIYVSPGVERVYGLPAAPFLEESELFRELVHPDDRAAFDELVLQVRRNGFAEAEYRIQRPDGEVRWVLDRARLIRSAKGEPLRVDGIVVDISKQRAAEVQLDEQRSQLQAIFNANPDALLVTDAQDRILTCNPAFARAFGYPPWEVAGRPAQGLWLEPEGFGDAVEAEETLAVYTFRRRSGETFPGETLVSSLRDADGAPKGWLVIVRDVSRRQAAEETAHKLETQMQAAQKLESLGLLAGGIAHDFNNLLLTILGNAGLAATELPERSRALDYLTDIETASHRAADLCRQMLAYSGRGHLVVEPIDLSQVVADMSHLLEISISKSIRLSTSFARGLPPIEADVTQVRQVIMNLITNASDAILDQSGAIEIATGVTAYDRASLSATYLDDELEAGCYVWVEVSDSGVGMDPATREKLFDPFFTTKAEGRGLGLAATLGIVRGHRGAIRVESAPGRGTRIRILFPSHERTVELASARPPAPADRELRGTILVVDDEEGVRLLCQRSLERAGLDVLTAADGQEALATYATEGERIDLVLLDLTMPHLDGAQVFGALRERDPEALVLLTSGYDEHDVVSDLKARGLAGFIQKPYRPQELVARVAGLLEARRAPATPATATPARA